MSNTVLSSCTQASWSGLLEWSSSCPLSWSVTSGRSTSRQSGENRAETCTLDHSPHFLFMEPTTSRCRCNFLFSFHLVWEVITWVFPSLEASLPGCLKRSLSTILHMQPSFWRTSCESGMLSMNFARRTLRTQWKKRKKVSSNYCHRGLMRRRQQEGLRRGKYENLHWGRQLSFPAVQTLWRVTWAPRDQTQSGCH